MNWGEIYRLGVFLDGILAATEALWLREVRARNGSAPQGFKLTFRGGPSKTMAEVPRVAVEVYGVDRFYSYLIDLKRSVWNVASQMQRRLDGGNCVSVAGVLMVVPASAAAVETLMRGLTELAVDFCGQPTRPEEEPRFSLEIEDFSGVATVCLEFKDAKLECQTSGHYRRAIFTSSVGTALDGIADVLAQAQAHLEARERRRGW